MVGSTAPMDIAALKKVSLFSNLNSDHLSLISRIATERAFKPSEVIFREGEPGSELFVIESGRVRISKQVPGVGEEAIAILEAGSYFGEMALIDDSPRSADAVANSAVQTWVITRDALDELMFLHKDLAYDLLWTFVRTLSGRLRETNEKIKAFFALSAHF